MRELRNIVTFTYELWNGFRADIVVEGDRIDSWLYHENIGIKMYIIGLDKNTSSVEAMADMIEAMIKEDGYMDEYKEEYMEV